MKILLSILNHKQKRNFVIQFFLMFIGMLLEIFSIGILLPIISLMQKGNLNDIKSFIHNKLLLDITINDKKLLLLVMAFLSFVYILKMIFLSYFSYNQTKFIYNLKSDVSYSLYKGYLYQPYIFHLKNNSAQLINNTIFLVDKLTQGLTSFMILFTESFTFLGIVVFLILVEPAGTISVILALGLLSILFFYSSKKQINQWGVLSQKHEAMRLQHLQQGLGGIKDVKILGREDEFLYQFQYDNNGTSNYNQKQLFFMSLPKFWLEMLAVLGLALLVIIMDGLGSPFSRIIPILGIFAAAAFRIIPSMNRILNAMQTVGFTKFSIEKLNEEFNKFVVIPEPINKYPYKNKVFKKINIENLTFKYPNANKPAIISINLTIEYGSSIGFIGTSGAGKSTLIDLILGLLKADSGKILVDDFNISNDISGWQSQIGYVPQNIFLTDDSLRNNIAFGIQKNNISEDQINLALKYSQLKELVESLPEGLNTIVGERGVRLSGGQRQRIGIARALYHNPSILVLDEATSALDTDTESNIMDSIKALKNDKTIIIIAHRLNTIEQCDYICKIEKGKLESIKKNISQN